VICRSLARGEEASRLPVAVSIISRRATCLEQCWACSEPSLWVAVDLFSSSATAVYDMNVARSHVMPLSSRAMISLTCLSTFRHAASATRSCLHSADISQRHTLLLSVAEALQCCCLLHVLGLEVKCWPWPSRSWPCDMSRLTTTAVNHFRKFRCN